MVEFLKEKLDLDQESLDELGELRLRKQTLTKKQKEAGVRDEYCVTFDSKQTRDMIKARAARLANFRDTAGMRLQIPDHLQKDFKLLMGLSYELKQRNPDLKRNVKFDEDELGLFMDVQVKRDGPWRQIKPEQARKAAANKPVTGSQTEDYRAEEIQDLLGDQDP